MRTRFVGIAAGILAAAATAQARAAETGVGLTLDYEEVMVLGKASGRDVTDHYDAIGASGLFDLRYARLILGYSANAGNQIRFVDGDEVRDDGYRIKYFNVTALGKYPIELAGGDLVLWPALGLRGAWNLQYAYRGPHDRSINEQPNDLLVVGGAGLDYRVAVPVALTASLLGTYDLTPGAGDGEGATRQFSAGMGIGAMWLW